MKWAFPRITTCIVVTSLLVVIGAAPISAAPAGRAPVLEVSNPAPNDYLSRGRHVISGIAYDPAAKAGSGVDQVTVFLGDRDSGGTFYVPGGYLGTATLGLPNTKGGPAQFASAGWSLKTKSLRTGKNTLFVYARSSVTGLETVVQIPIRVGKP